MANGDQFEDEPVLGGVDAFDEPPAQSSKIEFEGLNIATSNSERRRERRKRRNERTGMIAACILLVCILIAVILAITLEKEVEHVLYSDSIYDLSESPTMAPSKMKPTIRTTPSPTVAPKPTFAVLTPSPTAQRTDSPNVTPSPTRSPSPTAIMTDSYSFNPIEDTYLYLDGPYKGKKYGNQEKMWIQRGNKESTLPGQEVTLPTIVSIVQFDTMKKPSANYNLFKALPDRSRWPEQQEQVQVTLRIHHVPKSDLEDETDELSVEDILPINIEVYRLPNNNVMVVESLTGEDFHNAPKEVTEGVLVGQHLVEATDTVLDIDVTSAMFLTSDKIKDNRNNNITAYNDDQVMFLLKISWEEAPRQGDQFEARESEYGSPQLIFSNMI